MNFNVRQAKNGFIIESDAGTHVAADLRDTVKEIELLLIEAYTPTATKSCVDLDDEIPL